ncbi:MAG: site-specific integrase [Acidimicrobiia bacterium]|nr:site-specific integrase [Acidimicrobiia bacterium]
MRGYVGKRGKTWGYAVDVGRDPATGRRRQRTKGGFKTRREADAALAEVIRSVGTGTYVARDPQTLAEWIERWLPTMAPKIRPSTLSDYRKSLAHVTRQIGHVRLQALRPLDLEELYATLLKEGHRFGGGLAPKTVRNVHIALRRSLADAERFGLVHRNVAALVKAPAPTRPDLTTWSAPEVSQFLASVEAHRLGPAFRLLAATGMRRGEVLGLKWDSVDLDAGRLSVRRSLIAVDDELVWSDPKTSRSRRNLSLDSETVAVLRAHRRRRLEERLAAGELWEEHDLVFSTETGEALHPDRFSRAFERAVQSSGLPRIRMHDLRHTWATLALQAGIHPKVVSERLGHASTSITLDIYSHVQPELDAQAATAVALLFDAEPDADPGALHSV